ncbi:hypothetical protein AMQ83_34220 [Paenibacillus riograndensis]|nr:hypothetical protein AMQ83_34220 [Paenibacillus riograndensis]
MVENLNRSLTVALCLLLAFCASVFIGEETLISIVAIIIFISRARDLLFSFEEAYCITLDIWVLLLWKFYL